MNLTNRLQNHNEGFITYIFKNKKLEPKVSFKFKEEDDTTNYPYKFRSMISE
jgi:hypothetical protein